MRWSFAASWQIKKTRSTSYANDEFALHAIVGSKKKDSEKSRTPVTRLSIVLLDPILPRSLFLFTVFRYCGHAKSNMNTVLNSDQPSVKYRKSGVQGEKNVYIRVAEILLRLLSRPMRNMRNVNPTKKTQMMING